MKKFELILASSYLGIIALRFLHVPLGPLVTIIGMLTIISYGWLGVLMLTGNGFGKVFKKAAYREYGLMDWVALGISWFGMSIATVALLFKIQVWQPATQMQSVSTIFLLIALVFTIVARRLSNGNFAKRNLIRLAVFITVSIALWVVPNSIFVNAAFHGRPLVIEAYNEYHEDPSFETERAFFNVRDGIEADTLDHD